MTSIINDKGKIASDWVDLYGINVKNKAGSTVMTIDEDGVRFGTGFSPIKYQYASSSSGPWHDTMAANDKYRRESFDGGMSWVTPYQFVGTDGRNGANGSDASVTRANIEKALQKASTTSTSYIGVDSMGSPEIYGGSIYGSKIYGGEIYAGGIGEKGGQVIGLASNGAIFGDGNGNTLLSITKNDTETDFGSMISSFHGITFSAPYVTFNGATRVNFGGVCDFSQAREIKGIHATFA